MIEITKDTWSQVSEVEKAIVFFHKNGCSNCAFMKPIIAAFAKDNPEYKVFSYLCGSAPDEITKSLPIRVFPGVFCYENGKVVAGICNIFDPSILHFWFKTVAEKKAMFYDVVKGLKIAEQQFKNAQSMVQFIEDSIIMNEQELPGAEPTPNDDFPLQTPTISEDQKIPCDWCQ